MSWRRVRALLGKEWAEARRNRAVTWTFVLLALVLTSVPLVMTFGFFPALAHDLEAAPRTIVLLSLLQRLHPGLAALAPAARLQALLLRQFLSLFLVLPIFGAMTVATYSVVGERAARSREPLLATPLTTGEMLLGKSLAAALPAALGSWAAFAAFALAVSLLGGMRMAGLVVDGTSLLTMLLVTPLLALLGMAAGVLVSLRVRDPRGAQQVGGLLVLPVIALVAAQVSGVVMLRPAGVLAGAAVLLLLDGALLAWGVRLFDRERLFVEQSDTGGATATRPAEADRVAQLPSPLLTALWLGGAHASLLSALGIVALAPQLLAGAFWHPHLLAAAHLLTVGWITGTILGALYLVPPLAMRVRLGRHAGDPWAWASFAAGTTLLAAGFWRGALSWVALGGSAVLLAAAWVAGRVVLPLLRAPVPRFVRFDFVLAFTGLLLAGCLGIAVAVDRRQPFLPGGYFAKTFAHAQLAILGWALLLVLATAYRLLPMLLPAAMPRGGAAVGSGPLLLAGALTQAGGLLLSRRALVLAGGGVALGGTLLFVLTLLGMLRHPKSPPRGRPRPDLPLVHVAAAVAALLAAAVCGILLLLAGPSASPGLRAAYGVLALVGFFAQLIVGVEQRLVAWQAWLLAYAGAQFRVVPPSPYQISARSLQWAIAACWLLGVPLLGVGAGAGLEPAVRVAAVLLGLGTALSAASLIRGLRIAVAGSRGCRTAGVDSSTPPGRS